MLKLQLPQLKIWTKKAKSRLVNEETALTEDEIVEKQSRISPKLKKVLLVIGIVLAVLLAAGAVLGWHTYQQVGAMQAIGVEAEAAGRAAYQAFKGQNLPEVQTQLAKLDNSLTQIELAYNNLQFWQYVPIARSYYLDGSQGLVAARSGLNAAQKSINSIAPYADVLGFTGEGTFAGGTAEDRLKLIIETLDKVMPEFDAIAADVTAAETALKSIDPNRYPENLRGYAIRSNLVMAQDLATGATAALTEFRPVIEQLPAIAGGRGERKKYLILFQNDNELRPTGGFLTAYAIIFVENGKVTPDKSDDIYELDKKFSNKPPIPEELGRYLITEKRWNLRDMNTSPDFKVSMEQFLEYYFQVRGEPQDIDGVIALDTEFVVNLMKVLGPIEVPGYGTFTAEDDPRCDCPQIIYVLSEIITRPTPYLRDDRKGILGPLMRALLTKAYTAPKTVWPEMFQVGFDQVAQRHLQMYFLDEAAQQAAESLGGAGRMLPPESGDFVAIINSNLAGAKSNLFINYEVTNIAAIPENNKLRKTLEITYKNPRKADNCNLEAGLLCLNSTLNDWTRIYVPAGSELISAQGFNEEARTYDQLGFTVIDGFFSLEPLGTAKIKLEYDVPYTLPEYQLEVWKQGGITSYPLLVDVNGGQEQLEINKDTQFSTEF